MRPLVVFTGQGIARADGFNLTRRLKALPQLAALGEGLARGARQNLDAIIAAQAVAGDLALANLLRAVRTLCLKERRSTLRKATHREVFACLAAAAAERPVLHLTSSIDGLTTTFAVRDFGAAWAPFRHVATLDEIRGEAVTILSGRGLVHFPAHGEAPLVVSAEEPPRFQSYFGDPDDLRGPGPWSPSLRLGLAQGLADLENRFPLARLAYGLLEALVTGGEVDSGTDLPAAPHADLLVVGCGTSATGPATPFERRITALRAQGLPRPPARWTALVHRPEQNRRVAAWFAAHGFTVAGYGDHELAAAVRGALSGARSGCERATSSPPPAATKATRSARA